MSHLIEEPKSVDTSAFLYLNLHEGEEVKLIIRHHWGGFLGYIGLAAGMTIGLTLLIVVLALAASEIVRDFLPTILLSFSTFLVFLLTFLLGSWINFYYDIIFITNERIINIDQAGLLARKTSELNLRQVQNATAQVEGFLQTLLNYGLLVIETAGEGTGPGGRPGGAGGYFTIRDMPDPNRLARIIIDLHRNATKSHT